MSAIAEMLRKAGHTKSADALEVEAREAEVAAHEKFLDDAQADARAQVNMSQTEADRQKGLLDERAVLQRDIDSLTVRYQDYAAKVEQSEAELVTLMRSESASLDELAQASATVNTFNRLATIARDLAVQSSDRVRQIDADANADEYAELLDSIKSLTKIAGNREKCGEVLDAAFAADAKLQHMHYLGDGKAERLSGLPLSITMEQELTPEQILAKKMSPGRRVTPEEYAIERQLIEGTYFAPESRPR